MDKLNYIKITTQSFRTTLLPELRFISSVMEKDAVREEMVLQHILG